MITSLTFIKTRKKIEVDKQCLLGDFWDGNGDSVEMLETGTVQSDDHFISFDIVKYNKDIMKTVVKVICIY